VPVLGGCGFIISSLILMVEVQHKWYLPNLTDIGWHGTPTYLQEVYTASNVFNFHYSGLLEPHRRTWVHSLWSIRLFASIGSHLRVCIIHFLGQLGILNRKWDPNMGNVMAGARSAEESFRGLSCRSLRLHDVHVTRYLEATVLRTIDFSMTFESASFGGRIA